MWLAPNLITFVGFLFTVMNWAMLAYYDYEYYASSDSEQKYLPIPQWVWLVCAINHFLSHTLGMHFRLHCTINLMVFAILRI